MLIDAHMHAVPPKLPGVGLLDPILAAPDEERASALRQAMAEADVSIALGMGCLGAGDTDPLGIESTLRLALLVPGLRAIGAIDPRRTEPDWLKRVDEQLASGRVVALKCYLGYLHFAPSDPGYAPYFQLAEKYKLPVFFHSGDTYSPAAKLKYAQPLGIDDVAVDFPKVRFVIAHVGNPWLTEAAEVVYKNVNVWTDLSGLVLGELSPDDADDQALIADMTADLRRAFRLAERPNRFLFGTDWPLAKMRPYRDFVAQAIPQAFHDQVFAENARLLFRLG